MVNRLRITSIIFAAMSAFVLTGCQDTLPVETSTPSTTVETSPPPVTQETAEPGVAVGEPNPQNADILNMVQSLEVKGRAPKTGYEREQFGPAWTDTDHNGCDTRNDILTRDLVNVTYKPGTRDCVVLTGVLADPYSGQQINFQRGQDTSTAVQIDHVVALSDAWQKGAQQWDADKRQQFANDPLNLIAADGPLNGQKGDGDTATWLPPNKDFRCHYVARQVTVKAAYGLWVTQAEKDAMVSVLSGCAAQDMAFDPTRATSSHVGSTPAPVPAETVPTESAPAEQTDVDPQFSSCAKAKAQGYGPYTRDIDPEYAWYNDGDSDGVACE